MKEVYILIIFLRFSFVSESFLIPNDSYRLMASKCVANYNFRDIIASYLTFPSSRSTSC